MSFADRPDAERQKILDCVEWVCTSSVAQQLDLKLTIRVRRAVLAARKEGLAVDFEALWPDVAQLVVLAKRERELIEAAAEGRPGGVVDVEEEPVVVLANELLGSRRAR